MNLILNFIMLVVTLAQTASELVQNKPQSNGFIEPESHVLKEGLTQLVANLFGISQISLIKAADNVAVSVRNVSQAFGLDPNVAASLTISMLR
jgi:hypothetical protein